MPWQAWAQAQAPASWPSTTCIPTSLSVLTPSGPLQIDFSHVSQNPLQVSAQCIWKPDWLRGKRRFSNQQDDNSASSLRWRHCCASHQPADIVHDAAQPLQGVLLCDRMTMTFSRMQTQHSSLCYEMIWLSSRGCGARLCHFCLLRQQLFIQEPDLMKIFEPFGHIDIVNLQKDATGRSQGYGFVQ